MRKKYERLGFSFEDGFYQSFCMAIPVRYGVASVMNVDPASLFSDGDWHDYVVKPDKDGKPMDVFRLAFEIGRVMGLAEINRITKMSGKKPCVELPDVNVDAPMGHHRNADLLFTHEKTLHVFELSASGAFSPLSRMIASHESYDISMRRFSASTQINVGNITRVTSFAMLVDHLIEATANFEQNIEETPIVASEIMPETAKFIQAVCYATSYLAEHVDEIERGDIETVEVTALNPWLECVRHRVPIHADETSRWGFRALEMKNRYMQVKKRYMSMQDMLPRVKEMLKKSKSDYFNNANESVITPKITIARLRSQVADFMKRMPDMDSRVFFIGSCTGSGKTSSMQSMIDRLVQENRRKHGFIYFSPRLAINRKLEERLGHYFGEKRFEFFKSEAKPSRIGSQVDLTLVNENAAESSLGIVKRMTEKMGKSWKNEKFFMAVATSQSLTRAPSLAKSTAHALLNAINDDWERTYYVFIDEIMGSEGGVHAARTLLERMTQGMKNLRLVIMDANIPNERSLSLVFDVAKTSVVPPQIVNTPKPKHVEGWTETSCRIAGLNAKAAFGYSFPASCIRLRFSTLNSALAADGVVSAALSALKEIRENDQLFIYIQDRNMVNRVVESLSMVNALKDKVVAFSSLFKVDEAEAVCANAKVIVSTSTLSRGVDAAPRGRYCMIVISSLNQETEIAEIPQVIGRMRGDPDYDDKEKIVHVAFVTRNLRDDESRLAIEEKTSLLDYYMTIIEETGIEASPSEIKQFALDFIETLQYRHLNAMAILIHDTIASFINPELTNTVRMPIRLLHESVVSMNIIEAFDHVINLLLENASALLGHDRAESYAIMERIVGNVIKDFGLYMTTEDEIAKHVMHGHADLVFAWPFVCFESRISTLQWFQKTESFNVFMHMVERLNQMINHAKDKSRYRENQTVALLLERMRSNLASMQDARATAIFVPWLVLAECMGEKRMKATYVPPVEISRFRLRTLAPSRLEMAFETKGRFMRFDMANPESDKILRQTDTVIKLPFDLI